MTAEVAKSDNIDSGGDGDTIDSGGDCGTGRGVGGNGDGDQGRGVLQVTDFLTSISTL